MLSSVGELYKIKQNTPPTALLQRTGYSKGEDKYSIYLLFDYSMAILAEDIHGF